MHPHNINRFIQECLLIEDDTDEGLDFATLYGLYSVWCNLHHLRQVPRDSFQELLGYEGIRAAFPARRGIFFPGLWMVGPASRAYALNTSFSSPEAQHQAVWAA
ncbi:hypothetical protein [Arthrobacter sp. fls2-241-R2A-200]|uniref:hypothetical protein n=1 Tax=unclassified Arthrobacter TaxID=235627 RepID=UPI00254D7088|nr:hypothetical protein [Arthrobacter sp. fls2-241-R2A-200]